MEVAIAFVKSDNFCEKLSGSGKCNWYPSSCTIITCYLTIHKPVIEMGMVILSAESTIINDHPLRSVVITEKTFIL